MRALQAEDWQCGHRGNPQCGLQSKDGKSLPKSPVRRDEQKHGDQRDLPDHQQLVKMRERAFIARRIADDPAPPHRTNRQRRQRHDFAARVC
jgi:hypothetical protein